MTSRLTTVQRVAKGLEIINRYPHPSVSAEHDVIYAGCSRSLEGEDLVSMEQLGWDFDEELDSWRFFV